MLASLALTVLASLAFVQSLVTWKRRPPTTHRSALPDGTLDQIGASEEQRWLDNWLFDRESRRAE